MMAITNQITIDTSAHLLTVTQVVDDIFPLSIVMTEMISDDMRALNIVTRIQDLMSDDHLAPCQRTCCQHSVFFMIQTRANARPYLI